MATAVEIERKFVIKIPDTELLRLQNGYNSSEIVQIYLKSTAGITRRIRARKFAEKTEYTETVKARIDKMSVNETETVISAERFASLKELIAQGTVPISKVRHSFSFNSHVFEIDVYPEWKNTCIMEIELESRDEEIIFPSFISIVSEVTGDKRYSNAAMSRSFPEELICDTSCR